MRVPTVLLADDHGLFAEGLAHLLSGQFDVAGIATDGRQLVEMTTRLHPDLLVIDLAMPNCGGLEALRRLRAAHLQTRVVILTMHADARLASEALRSGASGFVLKHATGEELCAALLEVLQGRTYLPPQLIGEVLSLIAAPTAPADVHLTPRQRQVLEMVVEGRRMKEVAVALNLSPRTVETVKYEMMQALGVHSTAELVKYAIQQRLVAIDEVTPWKSRRSPP